MFLNLLGGKNYRFEKKFPSTLILIDKNYINIIFGIEKIIVGEKIFYHPSLTRS
jgi:hypothetical protein